MRDAILSLNEKEFILRALHEDQRTDGRRPFESRSPKFQARPFSSGLRDDGNCEVQLGRTRVLAIVSAELTPPFRDRPSEGVFNVSVDVGAMASSQAELGRPSEATIELTRLLERVLKQTGAVDTESLVVQAGRWVWSLRVDINVLDNDGDLAGAVSLAALAALLTFRRPEVTISPETGQLEEHSRELREPLPLSLHHLPVTIAFAFFDDSGELVVVDPSLAEELTSAGTMLVTVNAQRDVCGVHKAGGVAISSDQLMRCVRIATQQAVSSIATLQETVAAHSVARLAGRVRRHREALPTPGFVLGARLEDDSSARGAQVPSYFAGNEESDGDEIGGAAAPSWDDVAPAVAFPFAGPLLPASASKGGADVEDALQPEAPDTRMTASLVVPVATDDGPSSLLAAIKQPRQHR